MIVVALTDVRLADFASMPDSFTTWVKEGTMEQKLGRFDLAILTHLPDWLTLTAGSTPQHGRQQRQHGVVPASEAVLQLTEWSFDMVWHERLTCKVIHQQGFRVSVLSLSQETGCLYVQSTMLPVVPQAGA